ncbi:MAG: hypothetical protein HY457_03230, partial [Parcubacteria group bacterium]|nr:hypothetical protein [Parcubacteria group bacterium]
MRVAIVNNGISAPTNILRLLGKETVTVFNFSETDKIQNADFDLLILSGSSQFPIVYNREKLAREIALIQESAIPILGICYGCEVVAV